MSVHMCRQTENPRTPGLCACGKRLPVALERDPLYEQKFLTEVSKAAERRFGINSEGYADAVQRRLTMGQERYGDEWLRRNLPCEGVEEGLDTGAYAALDAQKVLALRADDMDEWAFHLFEAAVGGAYSTYHFQMARR